MDTPAKRIKTGIIGCGAIGSELASFVDNELNKYLVLRGLCDKARFKSIDVVKSLNSKPKVLTFNRLVDDCELIIEAASISAAGQLIRKTAGRRKIIIILSVGAFVKDIKLLGKISRDTNVFIPSGAIAGVDGISALAMGNIKSLRLITSKPPLSLAGAPFLSKQGIDVLKIKKEKIIFRGSIKEAIENFPKNINVAATLFLASRFKDIEVIVKVNPHIKRNTHRIEVCSDKGRIDIRVENVPSKINPKTSAMTILSVKNLLTKIINNLKVGS